MALTIRELGAQDDAQWDELIASSPQGKTFLRADWLHMLCATDPDYRLCILGCFGDDGQLVSGQALCYRERWGMRIVDGFEFLYSGPVMAPAIHKAAATRSVQNYKITLALSQAVVARMAYVAIETQPAFSDLRPYLYEGWQVTPVYSHLWHLDNVEQAWLNMNHGKRNQIRHAQDRFVFAQEESDEALAGFVALYRDTMTKFDWRPSVKWAFILQQRFRWMRQRDGCRMYTARTPDGLLVGSVIVILSRDDNSALLWRVGTSAGFVQNGGVPALYWHAAREVAREFPNVDFGWSPQASLSQFKDYMGAEAELHFRVSRCNSRFRLPLFQSATKLKDGVYNLVMPVAFDVWQRVRHGRGANGAVAPTAHRTSAARESTP